MSEGLIINHEEALALAHIKYKESNLARCYVAYEAEIEGLKAYVARLHKAWDSSVLQAMENGAEYHAVKDTSLSVLQRVNKWRGKDGLDDFHFDEVTHAIQQIEGM